VEQTNASFPQTFRGTVAYVGALIDPATRTTPVRIVTQNPQGVLKKDMFLDATIHTKSARTVLSVPTSAILRNDENLPFVYVEVQPGQFGQRLVTLGAQQSDDTEITSGLKPGEKIVAEGSVFLQFSNTTR
jgi:multidrug efflux pump subunit AcrA (membrane-fusion protein)